MPINTFTFLSGGYLFHLRGSHLTDMAGATGLEPATFGVTGRTKFNGINDSCKFFCG
jgi:hypothetical protein